MVVTLLTSHKEMSSSNTAASCSATRNGGRAEWAGISERWDRGGAVTKQRRKSSNTGDGGVRTSNMNAMLFTKPTFHPPMGLLNLTVPYSAARDGRPCEVSGDLGARGEGMDNGRGPRHRNPRAATHGMEGHVRRTCHSCSSPSPRSIHRWVY